MDLSKFSTEEFNTLFAFPVGNKIKLDFIVAPNHVVLIPTIQAVNNDTADHDFELQYQGSGFAGNLAAFAAMKVLTGDSKMLWPGDSMQTVVPLLQNALMLVGPCTMTLQDITALATAGRTIGLKLNWLEGISIADIADAVAPQVSTSP